MSRKFRIFSRNYYFALLEKIGIFSGLTESVQISHVKNLEGNDIAYSKCKILKILTENDWDQNPFTHKRFSKNFDP